MKIVCPTSWPQVSGVDYSAQISLAAILPKAGDQTHAFFFSEVLRVGDVAHILWQPPFTANNGWSERPAEIARSFILTAKVSHASALHRHQYRYDFEVFSCEPLLAILKSSQGDWALEEWCDRNKVPPGIFLVWEEVSWCGTANIDGLTYICANTSSEAHMELLVEESDGEMFGLLSTHHDPGGEYCYFGRRKFSTRESNAARKAIKQAVQLVDYYNEYLVD